MKRWLPALIFSLSLVLFPPPAQAKEKTSLRLVSAPAEYSWLFSREKVHGDSEGYALRLISEVIKNPHTPYAPLLIRELSRSALDTGASKVLESLVPLLLKRDLKNGYLRQELMELHRDILYRQGRYREAKKINLRRGYLKNWHVVGGFGWAGKSLFYRPFQPELDQTSPTLEMEKSYGGRKGKVRWKKIKIKGSTFTPAYHLDGRGGTFYALGQIEAEKRRPVILSVTSSDSYKIWVNGQLLDEVNRFHHYYTTTRREAIYLEKGWNRIFIKLPPDSLYGNYSSLAVEILDLEGNPLDLKEEKRPLIHPFQKSSLKRFKKKFTPTPWEHYSRRAKENPQDPYLLAAAGYLLLRRGLAPQGLHLIERAQKLAPRQIHFLHLLARAYQKASFLPDNVERNRTKGIYQKILAGDAKFLPAYLYLADDLEDNDKAIEALELLTKATKEIKDSFPLYDAMADICFREGWEAQGIEYIKECEKLNPQSSSLLYFWQNYYTRRGNLKKAWEYKKKLLSRTSQPREQLYQKYRYYLQWGQRKEAFEILQKLIKDHSKNKFYQRRLYEFYLEEEKWEKAIPIYQKISEDSSSKYRVYKNLGDLYRRAGKKKKAIEWYKKSLEERPSQISLGRYVKFLQGKEANYAKAYALEVKDFIKKAPPGSKYPKAHALTLIDQTVLRIYGDGATSETVHEVHKILDARGKERYHRARVRGDILQLRTIDPQGKIWEPIIPRQGSIVPPALQPGAVFEVKYRKESQWSRRPFQFRWGPFFFRDPGFDEPVLFSQLVVIVSKKYPIQYESKNTDQGPKIIDGKKDRIYIWTFQNQDRTEIERYMPPARRLLPYVQLYTNKSLATHIWRLGDRYSADVRVTPQTQELAQKALKGAEKKSKLARAKILYKFVHKLIPQGYGSGRSGSALKVLFEKQGDRSLLYAALLKAAGIPYHYALISPKTNPIKKEETKVLQSLARGRQLLLKVLPESDSPQWVGAGIRNLPFGKIPENLQGGEAYVFTGRGVFYKETLPEEPKKKRSTRMELDLSLTERGDLKGTLKLIMPGARGYRLKEEVKNWSQHRQKMIIQGLTNRLYPGANVDKFEFRNLDSGDRALEIQSHFSVTTFLRKEGDHYLLKPLLPPLRLSRLFAGKSKRVHEVFFPQSMAVFSRAKIDLGSGWKLKKVPSNLILEEKMGTYLFVYSLKGRVLHMDRQFLLHPFRLAAREYSELIDWARKIDSQERSPLLLKKQ